MVAHLYTFIERWMDWAEVARFFSALPSWHGVSAYHYIFIGQRTARLRALVFLMGNVAMMALLEDMAYFYLFGEAPSPSSWTSNIIGYVPFSPLTIPSWYFPALASYYLALKRGL